VNVGNVVLINEVALHKARLMLRISGAMRYFTSCLHV